MPNVFNVPSRTIFIGDNLDILRGMAWATSATTSYGDDMTTHPKISDSIERAAEILRAGGVVAVPTDTVYGIAANALDVNAIARVFALKGRADTSPSPLLVADADDLFRYGVCVSDDAAALARAFWPGGLTIVVRRAERVPAVATGGLDTVGLRVPNHPTPRALAAALGAPITGTSANVSGTPPLTSASDVAAALGDGLDMVFDGGQLSPSEPSTVIDATATPARILREGAVSRAEIERAGIRVV